MRARLLPTLLLVAIAVLAAVVAQTSAQEQPATDAAAPQPQEQPPLTRADELMLAGADAFARGELGAAERHWKRADELYAADGNSPGRLDAWLNLGAVLQQGGKFETALSTLYSAHDLAEEKQLTDKLAGIKNAIGVARTFTRRPEQAEQMLDEALRLAQEQNNTALEASVRNNLGNLYAAWAEIFESDAKADKYAKAFENYRASADLASKSGGASLAAKASTNAALSAARGGKADEANGLVAKATQAVKALPDDSLEKANLLISVGQSNQTLLGDGKGADAAVLQRRAYDAYEEASAVAGRIKSPLAASYARGYQGRLYESAGRFDEALTLTRRAVLFAQQAQSNDSLYLWQWQTGRIFKGLNRPDEAIAAYVRARDSLQDVRSDQALGYGNRGFKSSFRSESGPLYYELADLLLTRADTAGADEAKVQQCLADARDAVERLRVGELESYLEDPCVNQAQARQINLTTQLGKISRGNPAVVYIIPLEQRIEILVTTREGSKRVKSINIGRDQLTTEVREFRKRLEKRTTHRYLANAQQLYQWLIAPIEPELQRQRIDTLVFVPDGALRTVPMAALHDGTDFLIAKYAVAVSPGLSLSLSDSNEKDVSASAARILASGLSVTPPDSTLAPLPSVADELATIQLIYGAEATKLLNEDFQKLAFRQNLDSRQQDKYSIVHIASHGEFAADIDDTYVQTYDGQLNLTDLANVLGPYSNAGKPIDLLTLSACQTSAGDDEAARERASLGLGGLAVKAGARSAMASLWYANDVATSQLVTTFYEQLRDNADAGKAKALQQAQLQLIRNEDFSHPVYWAPFLMIGDWL